MSRISKKIYDALQENHAEKTILEDAADHMQVFCLNHGLLDKHSTAELFDQICKKLQKNTGENRHGIHNEGDEIICQKKEQADAIADLFEDMGVDVMHTSQEEDGWHVYFD